MCILYSPVVFSKACEQSKIYGYNGPRPKCAPTPVNTSGLIEPEGPGNNRDGGEIDSGNPDSDDEADEETNADIIAFKLFSISLDDADTNDELGD